MASAERRQAEEALRRSERHFVDFFENAPSPLHWVGADGYILGANQAELDLLGYTREEYVGHHTAEFHADPQVIDDILQRLARNETLHSYEARLRCKDGSIKPVLIDSNVLWEDGKFIHTRCFTRDLTDLKRAEAERAQLLVQSEARRRVAEKLAEVGRLVSQSLDPEELSQKIVENVHGLFGAQSSVLLRLEPGSEDFRVLAVLGELQGVVDRGAVFPAGTGAAGIAVRERRPVTAPDLPGHAYAQQAACRAVLAVPLLLGDRVIGALSIAGLTGRVFEPEEIRLAQAFADQAAVALENAGLFEEQTRLLRETRRQREEALALEAVARQLTSSLDRQEVLQRVAASARRLCACDLAFLAPYNQETDTATIVAASGIRSQALLSLTISRGRGLGGKVLETGEPWVTEDYLSDPRISKDYAEGAREEGTVAQAVVPLRLRGGITGLLCVVNRTPKRFTSADLVVLSRLADQAAIALENSRLYGDLRAALEEVEASHRRTIQAERLSALGELAGGVAHTFNNALAIIRGRVELLLARTRGPDRRQQLRVIEKTAEDLARTVRRIEEFTRVRRGPQFQVVDLNRIVEEVVEFTRPRWKEEAQSTGITYEIVTEPTALLPVAGDPSELREVLMNLLLNALDAMPTGGRLTFRTSVEGERVTCTVRDTGIGMTEEVRGRVFEPFFTTKGERGSGLGLSVVYGIVTRHGGQIEVESQVGHGTSFTLRLPVSHSAPDRERIPPPRTRRRGRILVIDDEPEVRQILSELLRAQGHTVAACPDGQSGLDRLSREGFDLVITDLAMPGLSGWEVVKLVKDRNPEIPVALLTGWVDRIDPEDARARGADFVMAKPFTPEGIQTVIAQALAKN